MKETTFSHKQQDFKATVIDTKLSVTAISSLEAFAKTEKEIDSFITSHTTNPLMLNPFLKVKMRSALSSELTPIVLVVRANEKIVGVATFVQRREHRVLHHLLSEQLRARGTDSLLEYWGSPDFILDKAYREESIKLILNCLFDTTNCRSATTCLPVRSPNLSLLAQQCEKNGTNLRITKNAITAYRFIPVNCSWDSFKNSRGRNFRRKFKKIERKFASAGLLRVLRFENEEIIKSVLQRVLEVEEKSWKQKYHSLHRRGALDYDLMEIWEAAAIACRTYSDFKFFVWLLELNGDSIAYCMGYKYKGTAYLAKTSFDDKWRKLYPGIYILNQAIRDLFLSGEVKTISFMTNLPFHETWASLYSSRVELFMWRGNLPRLLEFLDQFPVFQFLMRFP